jgi:hypothetical protein
MIRDTLIRTMREAGFTVNRDEQLFTGIFERFAALVAAAEREACADICDQHASAEGIAQRCADAIRARGQA